MKSIFHLLPLAALAFSADQIPLEDPNAVKPLTLEALPLLGFGTWQLKDNCSEAVSWAIQTGYRRYRAPRWLTKDGIEKRGLVDHKQTMEQSP